MAKNEPTALAHMVYFTLSEATAEMCNRLVEGCHQYLTDHPGTIHFSAGPRDPAFQRPVNDQTFDVALVVVFASVADHDTYQESERHQQFLREFSPCWSQVRVFDARA